MIAFEGVSVHFGAVAALTDVDLTVAEGALCVLVGPSGSGKSTLLRLANRLVEPTAGRVRVRGHDVARLDPTPLRRSIGYVIQSVGLFPHRTVAQNVATVPRLLGWDRARIARRVDEMLTLVRLDGASLRDRLPGELSGGQAQRVGLARALAGDPDLLLMDEPFGAVDPITRRALRAELKRVHAETGKTVVLVTHDPAEALELATHLVVLRAGRVVAAGGPAAVTGPEADPFVRSLIGPRDLALRRLDLATVAAAMTSAPASADAPVILETETLGEALARMLDARRSDLEVRAANGDAVLGSLTLDAILEHHP